MDDLLDRYRKRYRSITQQLMAKRGKADLDGDIDLSDLDVDDDDLSCPSTCELGSRSSQQPKRSKQIEHFDLTGEKKLPLPRVKSTRKIGSTVQHRLVYEDDP